MFLRVFALFLSLYVLMGCASTKSKNYEKYYQAKLCNELGGKLEVVLVDKTRVDCVTDQYAIEIDFAKKWPEGVGQSLYYAHMTNKKPAIGLIIDKDRDEHHYQRLEVLADKYKIKIFRIEK